MSVAPYLIYNTKYFSEEHILKIKEKFLKISDALQIPYSIYSIHRTAPRTKVVGL